MDFATKQNAKNKFNLWRKSSDDLMVIDKAEAMFIWLETTQDGRDFAKAITELPPLEG